MSEDARRTYETPKKIASQKKSASELKKEKGEKTLKDSGKQPIKYKLGKTGKEKRKARKQAIKSVATPSAEDRKEREPTPKLGKTVKIILPKTAIKPRSALTQPKILYQDIVQGFYDKSGKLPSQSEQIKYLKSQGIENVNKFKAKSIGEALNRVAYVASEIAGGGFREATLGLTGSIGVEKRRGQVLQITGGLITPSALDYVAGAVATKLSKTKAGQRLITKAYHTKLKILNKIDDFGITEGNLAIIERAPNYIEEDKFTMDQYRYMNRVFGKISKSDKAPKEIAEFASDNVRLFESITGKGLPSTTERREAAKAIRRLNDLLLDTTGLPKKIYGKKINGITVEEISHLPKETLEELMGDTLKYYKANPDAPRQYVINKNPETDLFRKTINEIGYFDDVYINMLNDPKGKVDPNLVASILLFLDPKERSRIFEEVADYNLTKPIPGLGESETPITTPTEDTAIDQPPTEDTTEDTTIIPVQPTPIITIPKKRSPEEEPTEEITPEITPPIKLTSEEQIKRRQLPLKIYAGPKNKWRVTYDGDGAEVEARGVIDALKKTKRGIPKKQPKNITITRVT